LISGTEKIGVNPLDTSTVVNPYNDEKDIAFYAMSNKNYRHADQDVFFVFFPHDAHRPCVKVLENGKVKKVVYKVRLAQ
jgi:YhcH/YjgK/YiaL family protein